VAVARNEDRRIYVTSKYLSKYLRHMPEELGLALMPGGWVEVDALLAASERRGFHISRDGLEEVVARNVKKRFAFDESGTLIRAQQAHSAPVDLDLEPAKPPEMLYHGTPERNLTATTRDGLLKMRHHHVHLSPDEATARAVGARRGCPVLLAVHAEKMHHDGYVFYRSGNGVWLVEHVSPRYLSRL
jgi:putative RNA 2'-phosphotransferase